MAEEPEENGKQKGPEERQGEVGRPESSVISGPRTWIFSEAQGSKDNWIETQRTLNGISGSTNPSQPRSSLRSVKGACFIKRPAYRVNGIDWIV